MKLADFLKSKGYDTTDTILMKPYIKSWKSWYVNKVPSFQNYTIYNGTRNVKQTRYTLGMAKKISEDYANLLLNEKASFNVGNERENKLFNEILDINDFYNIANSGVEKTFAYGTGAFVLSLGDILYDDENKKFSFDRAKLKIEFVSADKIIPLSYNQNKVIECAFGVERVIKGKKYLYVTIHKLDNIGNYVIENYLFEVNRGDDITDISNMIDDTFVSFPTESSYPWFSILRPKIENSLYDDSPFGMSIFGNSIDKLKGLDIAYDSFVNEFILGKKRIMAAFDAVSADIVNGELQYSFDSNDVVFYRVPKGDDDKDIIKEIDMKLRIEEHEKGIQLNLKLLSGSVGLGNDYYKFDKDKVSTATEVISNNSELFRAVHKHEIAIENCLSTLFRSICYISNHFLKVPISENAEISINFDDSIFEDTDSIKKQALTEYNNGLISRTEYYRQVYKLEDKAAKDFAIKMKEEIIEGTINDGTEFNVTE